MTGKAYHIPHGTEKNKTLCGREIEVGGRPKVLLTTSTEKKTGSVCGKCKELKAGKPVTESKGNGKKPGVGKFMAERIKAGDDTAKILAAVRVKFPQSKAKGGDVSIIRSKVNKGAM